MKGQFLVAAPSVPPLKPTFITLSLKSATLGPTFPHF